MADHAQALREEASRAKEEAAAARGQAARAQADFEYERRRGERQAEYLEEQRLQMQQVAEHSSKYQVSCVLTH